MVMRMANDNLKELFQKYMDIKSGQPHNMADGGKAESDDSIIEQLSDSFKKAFSTPKPAPTPDPTLQEKYEKIRQKNRQNFDNPNDAYASGGKVGSGERFAKLENKLSNQPGVNDPAALAASIGRKKYGAAKMNSMAHAHMADGGEVQSDPSSLQQLYQKFLDLSASKSGSGMGDVQRADAASRSLPIMSQGYSNPEDYAVAEQLQNNRRDLAQQGLPASNVSPNDVKNQNMAQNIALGTMGGLKNLPELRAKALIPEVMEQSKIPLENQWGTVEGDKIHSEGMSMDDAMNKAKELRDARNLDPEHNAMQNAWRKLWIGDKAPNTKEFKDARMKYLEKYPEIAITPQSEILGAKQQVKNMGLSPDVLSQDSASSIPMNQENGVFKPKFNEGGFVPEGNIKHYDDGGYIEPSDAPAKETDLRQQVADTFKDKSKPAQMQASSDSSDQPSIREFLGFAGGGQIPQDPRIKTAYFNKEDLPQHFDGSDGSVVQPNYDAEQNNPDLSPEEIAARQAELEQMKAEGAGQIPVEGDEQDIVGKNPAKESDVEESEDPEDKQLEEEMSNENFKAGEKGDESEDQSDEESPEKELASEPSDASGLKTSSAIENLINAQKQQRNSLSDAQKQRDNNIANNQFQQGAELFASGIARTDPSQGLAILKDQAKYANLPVQKYEEQIANQQHDPNSPMSQVTRDYLNSKGMKVPDSASASDLFKIAPFLAKDQALQMSIQKVLLQQQGAAARNAATNKTKEEGFSAANQRAQESNALKKQENQIRQDQLKAVKQQNQDNKANSDFEKMGKLATAEIASSRSPFGKAANVVRSAEQLEALGKQYGDLNQLDNRQIAEIARGLDSMLASGAATVTGASHLLPSTASGSLAKIEEYITSLPAGAKQKEFVQRMMDTVSREKQIANQQMVRTQGKILAPFSHLKKNYPERYEATLKGMGIPSEEQPQYSKDVTDYASQHNISPDQALAIKQQRTGGQ